MKKCSCCKETKELKNFSFKNKLKNTYQAKCKVCVNLQNRELYLSDPQPYMDRARERREKLRQYVRELKESLACKDCGKYYPFYVMDFDHISDDKSGNINRIASRGSWKKLREEIDKCELVCSNCHRQRTHERLGY